MIYRRTGTELLYTLTASAALAAAFKGAAWGYPQGRTTIWIIGALTIVAEIAMTWPQLRDAWRSDRGDLARPSPRRG